MKTQEIYEILTEIVRDLLMRDDIILSSETSAKDVDGWDSFKMVEIILAVEERFSIRVPSKALDDIENVGMLVQLIQQDSTRV